MNADLTLRAAIATPDLTWIARGDMFEKLLEDAPGPRRTSILHAPAGTRVACTDALILDTGVYMRGDFVATAPCTVFVKQRPSRDRAPLELEVGRVPFVPHDTPGLSVARLHEADDGRVVLLRFDPGTYIGPHVHARGEEFLVLDGAVTDDFGTYTPGAWVRQPPGSAHSIESPAGCLFLTFADHLG